MAAATAFTAVISAATGVVGTPVTITVALDAIDGTSAADTITPSVAAGNAGEFTPATVVLSTAVPSATIVYTPYTAGVHTISFDDSLSLTDPADVTCTVADVNDSSMLLTWTAVSGAARYDIFQNNILIGGTTYLNFVVQPEQLLTHFKISAVNSAGVVISTKDVSTSFKPLVRRKLVGGTVPNTAVLQASVTKTATFNSVGVDLTTGFTPDAAGMPVAASVVTTAVDTTLVTYTAQLENSDTLGSGYVACGPSVAITGTGTITLAGIAKNRYIRLAVTIVAASGGSPSITYSSALDMHRFGN